MRLTPSTPIHNEPCFTVEHPRYSAAQPALLCEKPTVAGAFSLPTLTLSLGC